MLTIFAKRLQWILFGLVFSCGGYVFAASSTAEFSITFQGSIGTSGEKDGQVREPAGIAVYGKKVFVSDTGNNRLQILSPEGSVQKVIGQKGKKDGEFSSPRGLAI